MHGRCHILPCTLLLPPHYPQKETHFDSHLIHRSLGQPDPRTKRHSDRVGCKSRIYGHYQRAVRPTDRQNEHENFFGTNWPLYVRRGLIIASDETKLILGPHRPHDRCRALLHMLQVTSSPCSSGTRASCAKTAEPIDREPVWGRTCVGLWGSTSLHRKGHFRRAHLPTVIAYLLLSPLRIVLLPSSRGGRLHLSPRGMTAKRVQ